MPRPCSLDLDVGIAQSVHVGDGGNVVCVDLYPGYFLASREVETALEVGAFHLDGSDPVHAAVAVHVAQVSVVDGVLGRLLGMPREPDAPGFEVAPVVPGRFFREAPLWRPSAGPPPGEDEAQDFARLENFKPGGPGRRRVGRLDALPCGVVLEPVEGTDEAAVPHHASDFGAQLRAQMRAEVLRHADAPRIVAPDDDLFAHPGFLDQFFLFYRLSGGDEVPAFRKRIKRGRFSAFDSLGFHRHPPSPGSKAVASPADPAGCRSMRALPRSSPRRNARGPRDA